MRVQAAVVSGIAAIIMSAAAGLALGQEAPQLAREGVGLLPPPPETPATLSVPEIANPFVPDPSGGFSRIVFQTDENPDFKIVIRDYAVLPDQITHALKLPTGALLHVISGEGDVHLGENRLEMNTTERTVAPPGATLNVANRGESPVVIRALTLEPK